MFLATTALSSFWDQQEETVFLGPWCGGERDRTLPSPWDDRERFHSAAEYLDRRMEQVLPPLADCLNARLGHSGDPRYWRILIGTWLLHSLHVTYDRWIHLAHAFEKHPSLRTFLLEPASFQTPVDTRQTVHWMMTDDRYNLQIFSQLLAGMGCSFSSRRFPEEGTHGKNSSPLVFAKRILRTGLLRAESAFFRAVNSRPETALFEMYCRPSVLWALARETGFKAVPAVLPEGESENPADPGIRESFRAELSTVPAEDEFTRLWVRSLPVNFPTLYLEGFRAARERALRRLRRSPRTLVSATAWHYSEPFKFLAAEHFRRGGRLLAVQHGGGYGLFRSMPMEQQERRSSDSFLGWGEVPSLQMAPLAREQRRTGGKKGHLLFVATTNPRYPFRFYSAPQAHQLEEYFEWQARFLENLGDSLRNRILIRLHPLDFGHNRRQQLEERFGCLRWDRQKSFSVSAGKSNLIVVDHPGTPTLGVLAGNVPALLFWDPRLWEFRPEAKSHLDALQQAGLFYDDPREAAKALQKILLEGAQNWWDRPTVRSARGRFVQRWVPMPENWLEIWSERVEVSR